MSDKCFLANIVLVFVVVMLVMLFLVLTFGDNKYMYFWIEAFSGSALPAWIDLYDSRSPWLVLAFTWHFVLNFAPALGVLAVFWRLITQERRQVVRFAQLLSLRDQAIQNELLSRLDPQQRQEFEQKLEVSFGEGSKIWVEEHLATLVGGREQAERIMREQVRLRSV